MVKVGLVGAEEATNIRLQVSEFELLIITFFIQSASLFPQIPF